jgi:hypothetical protein
MLPQSPQVEVEKGEVVEGLFGTMVDFTVFTPQDHAKNKNVTITFSHGSRVSTANSCHSTLADIAKASCGCNAVE